MSQNDRGAYTPQTDAPLAFDARPPRGGRRPLPMALIGSAVVLLVLIAAVVMYYRSGVRSPETAAVGQPVGDIKSAPPANAQGTEDPFSNLDVYASQNVPNAAPAFAPGPEQPQPRPAPAPANDALKVQTVEANPIRPIPAAPAAPAMVAKPAPAPAPAAPAAPAPAPVKTAQAAPAPAAAGGAMVQIGAFSSTALADKGYGDVAKAFPAQMAGKSKKVETVTREGQSPLYRGLIGGFADRGAAQAFCNTLKAAGRTCLVRG
jgi:cell division protein FtsN